MIIKFLGHACFFLKSDNGPSIITDPYKPGAYGGALTYGPITDMAELAVVSHDHEDNGDINSLPNQPLIIRASSIAHGVEFDVVQTFHDTTEGKERGPNRVTRFILDEIRFCHMGDLGHVLSDRQIQEIGDVDVIMLPVGGTFTIGPEEANQVIEQLKPKIAIPMHYRTEKCGFPILPLDPFLEGKSHVRKSPGSEVILQKEDLPEEMTILYLPPAN